MQIHVFLFLRYTILDIILADCFTYTEVCILEKLVIKGGKPADWRNYSWRVKKFSCRNFGGDTYDKRGVCPSTIYRILRMSVSCLIYLEILDEAHLPQK